MNTNSRTARIGMALAPFVLTLLFTAAILLVAGANPFEAYANIIGGALESPRKLADVMVALVPLLLASAGMLVTFAAGLWNIGVEGQMVAGALMTTWVVRSISAPSAIMLPLTVLAGMLGGALWGMLIGILRTYGHVNEIFAGLGLNYVAAALTNYLIFGPWRPPDGSTMSGTEPFPASAWMPTIGTLRAGVLPLVLAITSIVVVHLVLKHTYWGLKLKAVGANRLASERMGINSSLNMLLAFAVCGLFAGLGGSLQTTAVYHRLVPSITGGYGYLSQLVVLLSGLRATWVPLVVLFFSIIQVGSPRLELRMMLNSSLGGVLQATVVLFFLLTRGLRQRLEAKKEQA